MNNTNVINEMNNQRVRFFALGGLGEIGKNMYICEIDDRIFILDAGSKIPSGELLGIDNVYPNIDYLKENSNKIAGIFLSHAHDGNIGATVELLKLFNVGIFASYFTISVLENKIKDAGLNITDYRLYKVNEEKTFNFGPTKVEFFFVSHSVPETLGVAIYTESGVIVYAPEFTFNVLNDKKYRINFDKITQIGKDGVLLLASGSQGVFNITGTRNDSALEYNVSQLAMKDKRIIISMYSDDLKRLQKVIDVCLQYNRRIALIGRKTQKLINVAINLENINVPKEKLVVLKFRDEEILNDDKDLAIIYLGLRHEPYFSILRMCKGQDKIISLMENDEILFIAPPQVGCEKIASSTIDEILMGGAKCYSMSESDLRSDQADGEELKMMYNLLKPKYIIPISGDFRHLYTQKKIASSNGYKDNQILIGENGDIFEFMNSEFRGLVDHITCGDVMVDGAIVGDVNDMVLKDRELLSEDGIIIVSALIDLLNNKILDGPQVKYTGVKEDINDVFFNEIESETVKFLNSYFRITNKDELPSCNELLRDHLMKLMFNDTIKRPIIIPCVVEIKE